MKKTFLNIGMAIPDKLKQLFDRKKTDNLDIEEIKRLADQLIDARNFQELKNLLIQYRDRNDVTGYIGNQMWQKDVIRTPECAADRDVIGMIKAFRDSCGIDTERKLLPALETTAHPFYGTLAMHTYMLDVYLQEHPESNINRPDLVDVDASETILNRLHKDKDIQELCGLALHNLPVSPYVMYRYLLAEHYEKLSPLYNDRAFELPTDDPAEKKHRAGCISEIERRLRQDAGYALESIRDTKIPIEYLKAMDDDLNELVTLAKCPLSIKEANESFLKKHGIQPDNSIPEQLKQVERAYRTLEARFCRLTEIEPFADILFASVRQKRAASNPSEQKKQPKRKPEQKPQSKGKKIKM